MSIAVSLENVPDVVIPENVSDLGHIIINQFLISYNFQLKQFNYSYLFI